MRPRARSISSQANREPLDINHIGLVNLGNSCFFNTIVQSLAISGPLADLLTSPPASSPALDYILKDHAPEDEPASPLPISTAFVGLVNKLSPAGEEERGGALVFNPKGLLRQLANKYPDYQQATQQDAHELLMHLYEGVSMEERDLIKKLAQLNPPASAKQPRKRRLTLRATDRPEGTIQETDEEPRSSSASVRTENGDTPGKREPDTPTNATHDTSAAVEAIAEPPTPAAAEEAIGSSSEESSGEDDTESESSSSDSSVSSDDEVGEELLGKLVPKVKPRPFIESLFGGNLAGIIVCEECKQISLNQEEFMDISLALRDDASTRVRKRDKIRKTLQSGFFSRKSKPEENKPSKESRSGPHASASLSDYEASSDDEFSEDDTQLHPSKSRSNSLDTTAQGFRRPGGSLGFGMSGMSAIPQGREPSPSGKGLGRALSVLSGKSSQPGSTRTGTAAGSSTGGGRLKPRIPKPSAEQIAYIRTALAEVPGPGPNPALAQLRFAQPPGSQASLGSSASNGQQHAQKWTGPGPDPNTTDLFDSFRQFTAVESLDGDNAFACKNCWKLLNPELVRKHKRERLIRHQRREDRRLDRRQARKAQRKGTMMMPDITNTAPTPALSQNGEEVDGEADEARSDIANGRRGEVTSLASSPAALDSVHSLLSQVSLNVGEEVAATDPEAQAKVAAPALPLTVENVSAVPPASPAPKGVRKLAPAPPSAASASARSGASLSTRQSAASLSGAASNATGKNSSATNAGKNEGITLPPGSAMPPKRERHVLRKASKRYLLHGPSLPPALVVHLKRFQNASKSSMFGSSFKNLQKRDDPFSFPLEMDLAPFLAPVQRPPRPRGVSAFEEPRPQHRHNEIKVGSTQYRLYSAVVHIGTLSTGHYVCYCLSDRYRVKGAVKEVLEKAIKEKAIKEEGAGEGLKGGEDLVRKSTTEEVLEKEAGGDGGQPAVAKIGQEGKQVTKSEGEQVPRRWFYCSDEDVRACSVDEVMRSKAYMLFYERINKRGDSPLLTPANGKL